MNTVGIVVLVATLLAATAAGVLLRSRDGALRAGGTARGGWELAGVTPGGEDRVLLLQLSSPVCTPCRQAAGVLSTLADRLDGVVHHEVDIAERPEVASALSVMRTPTIVAFDRTGAELLRLSGVPKAAELEAAIAGELRM